MFRQWFAGFFLFFCDVWFYEVSVCFGSRLWVLCFLLRRFVLRNLVVSRPSFFGSCFFPLEYFCAVQNSEFLRSRCRHDQNFEKRGEFYEVSLCFDGRLWVSLFLWDLFLMHSKVVNSWETEVGVNRILRIKESSANSRCVLTFVLAWRFPLMFFFVVVSNRAFLGSRGRHAQNLENWGGLCEILWSFDSRLWTSLCLWRICCFNQK